MAASQTTDEALLGAQNLLLQILQLYKELGPESMESLTSSYLAAAPTKDSAKDPAEGMMAEAFGVFDAAADTILREFAVRQGFDLANSKNYQRRKKEGYFGVMYPALVMYVIWLDREGQERALKNLGNVFASFMFGTAGYVILDTNLDEGKENPAEILLSLSLVQESERLLLEALKLEEADYELLNRFKQLYLAAEVREKRMRFVGSPYSKDHPEDCGYKAVHAYLPFAIMLRKAGKEDQIDEYLQLFYEWGAPLQIMDDLNDLEDDLINGHYSYPTIGFEKEFSSMSPGEAAAAIRCDVEHIKELSGICKDLIERSRRRALELKADLWRYFIDILEERLDRFFSDSIRANEADS